jgi:hypothetical protein
MRKYASPRVAKVRAGQTLMAEGEAADDIVLVLDGMVEVDVGGTVLAITPRWAERAFYRHVRVHAALGIIRDSDGKRADHTSVQDAAYGGNPGGLLGYATAWLEYRFRGNATAGCAFSGPRPELVSNTNWPGSAAK